MKTETKVLSAIALAILLVACAGANRKESNQNAKNVNVNLTTPPPPPSTAFASRDADGIARNEHEQTLDSSAGTYMSSSAAVERGKDTSRRFVRTADLNFRVKNVIKATYSIEDIVHHFGGIVTYTDLKSLTDNTTIVQVSPDSSLETTYFTIVNTMTLRVPHTNLDTTLKCMAPLVDFFNYRIIKANNVSFDIFSNLLAEMRMEKHNERLGREVSSTKNKSLAEVTNAENDITSKEAEEDNIKVDIMRREDSIKYSVITLNIYQRQSFKRTLIANDKNIDAYQPGFGQKFVASIKSGWNMLTGFILFLTQMWSILLILGVVGYFVYRMGFRTPKE